MMKGATIFMTIRDEQVVELSVNRRPIACPELEGLSVEQWFLTDGGESPWERFAQSVREALGNRKMRLGVSLVSSAEWVLKFKKGVAALARKKAGCTARGSPAGQHKDELPMEWVHVDVMDNRML